MSAMIQCISPVNGKLYAERPAASLDEAREKVRLAREAQAAWAALPLQERIKRVLAGIDALNAMNDTLVEELAWQMGRPTRYGGEMSGTLERAHHMADIAEQALAPTTVEHSATLRRYIEREPVGVVLIIAPWNYPHMTAINTLVPALVAGNSVLLKHASQTLLVGERLAEAMHRGGVPEAVFQNVYLEHATTESLIQERLFGFVNFTGSVRGGVAIERAAAGTFTETGLELGGKDPGYVRADANLDAAVEGLMDGAIFNAGQCCCGIERVYVHHSLYDAFVEKAVAWIKMQKLGNPFDADTTLGPMAHRRIAQVVRDQVAEAVKMGAQAHIPASWFPEDDGGAYLMPQLLTHVDHSMRVMREESFGPVLGVMPVQSDAEAVALMNDSPYGLTASIWTADIDIAASLGAQLETGTVFMNRCDYLDPALCWTGCKDTGRSTALSELGYHAVTRPKSYHLKEMS